MLEKQKEKEKSAENTDFEAKQNAIGFFDLLLKIDKRNNPEKYKVEIISELREIRTILQRLLTEKAKKNATKGGRNKTLVIGKLEIIGRDKIEQYGNKNTTRIKNIATNYPGKKWFLPNNFLVWIIGTIIAAVIAGLILNWLLR